MRFWEARDKLHWALTLKRVCAWEEDEYMGEELTLSQAWNWGPRQKTDNLPDWSCSLRAEPGRIERKREFQGRVGLETGHGEGKVLKC